MPRRRPEPNDTLLPFDLTPLIDIVFLLLIFFMVSARFLDPRGFEVELPEAAEAPGQVGVQETPMLLVRADGGARWDGRDLAPDGSLEMATPVSEVILQADREARHGAVIRWMDLLKAAGVVRVTLATEPRPTGRTP